MPHRTAPLLALPDALLREVLSWSPDANTANALLEICHATHQLRHDATAVALLLMRCTCNDYCAALASCGATCCGGTATVVQQILQLVSASPASGGPHTAPLPLLKAMLVISAAEGDAPAVRTLLALPQPPDVNADDSRALRRAVCLGGNVAAVQALLDSGANLCACDMECLRSAARVADQLPVLQLLLRHCPRAALAAAARAAFNKATATANLPAVTFLLTLPGVDTAELSRGAVVLAAMDGHAALLRVLLDHVPPSQWTLQLAAAHAVVFLRPASLEVLLGYRAMRGAHAEDAQHLLEEVVQWSYKGQPAEQRDTVALLLRHGAVATAKARSAAEQACVGRDLLALLQ